MASKIPSFTEDNAPVLEEIHPGSKRLILAFGGIKGALGMPTFEFYQSANLLQDSKIFFRDLSQNWYHAGLPGISRDIDETCDYIRSRIDALQPEEILFIGNSMGGYAAILFSTLLNTGKVVSFSPQTFISPVKRLKAGDRRWGLRVFNTYVKSLFRPRYFDLYPLLAGAPRDNSITIHCSSLDTRDLAHARQLSGFPNVEIRIHDIGGHRLVKHLRDNGTLKEILGGGS